MFPTIEANQIAPNDNAELIKFFNSKDVIIARGNGRCYGDSSLQTDIISTLSLNKILSFDQKNGILSCEAGILLSEILKVIIPKGFFLPVTPGTKLITLGGAVASNIHGKNHHSEGSFSRYVLSFELLIETGEILHCSETSNFNLFKNTMGGMGLTGIILSVKFKLKKIESSYIKQTTIKAKNLDSILSLLEIHKRSTYAVSWIDCLSKGSNLGKSVLFLGEHVRISDLNKKQKVNPLKVQKKQTLNIPFYFPLFVLNRTFIRLFNLFYYKKQLHPKTDKVIDYDSFFYPLDSINNWNKMYGKNGFVQYQFVIPFESGKEGLREILNKITNSGCGAFLAVLKTFGKEDAISSPISFPMEGYTLAVDFKVNNKVLKLLDELDEIVLRYGGRFYLAKDARMSAETFSKSYKVNFVHPQKFNSMQSQRLGI